MCLFPRQETSANLKLAAIKRPFDTGKIQQLYGLGNCSKCTKNKQKKREPFGDDAKGNIDSKYCNKDY